MKKFLSSFISFSRPERLGIAVLVSLLLILIAVRAAMHVWVHPDFNAVENKRLAAAWDSFKERNANVQMNDSIVEEQQTWLDRSDHEEAPMPDTININTADSATLVRLKGIGPATAGKIIRWRKENGAFTSVDQILEIHHIPDATFAILRQHLSVK